MNDEDDHGEDGQVQDERCIDVAATVGAVILTPIVPLLLLLGAGSEE